MVNYATLQIPRALADHIDEILAQKKFLGFRNRTELTTYLLRRWVDDNPPSLPVAAQALLAIFARARELQRAAKSLGAGQRDRGLRECNKAFEKLLSQIESIQGQDLGPREIEVAEKLAGAIEAMQASTVAKLMEATA